jgi:hypothetical protein
MIQPSAIRVEVDAGVEFDSDLTRDVPSDPESRPVIHGPTVRVTVSNHPVRVEVDAGRPGSISTRIRLGRSVAPYPEATAGDGRSDSDSVEVTRILSK